MFFRQIDSAAALQPSISTTGLPRNFSIAAAATGSSLYQRTIEETNNSTMVTRFVLLLALIAFVAEVCHDLFIVMAPSSLTVNSGGGLRRWQKIGKFSSIMLLLTHLSLFHYFSITTGLCPSPHFRCPHCCHRAFVLMPDKRQEGKACP